MRRLCILAAALLNACSGHVEVEVHAGADAEPQPEAETSQQPKTRPKTLERPAPQLDGRSSYDLAAAIGEALQEPSFTREQALDRVRSGWRGKRYRWEVGVSSTLCRRADNCNVFPFDHARGEARIVQGWLPKLELDEVAHADLLARCGPALCVARVEATLSGFVLSPEDPTSLTFSDVSVEGVRARGDNESWVRRKADPRVAGLRTRHAGR